MATLLLNANGDLDVTSGTVEVTTNTATEYRQKVQARLQSFKGEWRYELGHGMPYYERIYVKNPQLVEVQEIFRRTILSVPGGQSVTFNLFDFNALTRVLSFSFQVQTNFSVAPLIFSSTFDLYKDAV